MENKSKPFRFGVIGDPVAHSLSPQIHALFAAEAGDQIDYRKYPVELGELYAFVKDFFKQQGAGLNVTLPYKQMMIDVVDKLTDEAALAQSVNTLFIDQQNRLVGATTDGDGLLYDLVNNQFAIEQKHILVVGAGGAARSIIPALINAGAIVHCYNRSPQKQIEVTQQFLAIGELHPFNVGQTYDGVICAISTFDGAMAATLEKAIGKKTFCYDLNYAVRADSFKRFAQRQGAQNFSDGLGMLIGQAAKSYQLWHGTQPVISDLQRFKGLLLKG